MDDETDRIKLICVGGSVARVQLDAAADGPARSGGLRVHTDLGPVLAQVGQGLCRFVAVGIQPIEQVLYPRKVTVSWHDSGHRHLRARARLSAPDRAAAASDESSPPPRYPPGSY